MRRDVFQAIADPTRREIIDLLAGNKMNLNTLADNFTISRPGREHYCSANLQKFREVSGWVEKYRAFWNTKLDALGDFLEKETNEEKM